MPNKCQKKNAHTHKDAVMKDSVLGTQEHMKVVPEEIP